MTDDERIIIKAINYQIVQATGKEGIHALLTADDLLAAMAVPVTQFDFTYVDKSRLKKLFLSVERFMKFSKLSVNSYTKAGLQTKFETVWVPTLSQEEKQELIADFRIVDGFDEEGYAIFNEKTFLTWKDFLGRRAQNMLNFAVIDEDDPDVRHYWSTPTTRARRENGLWVWELRPELMKAR